MRLAEIGRHQLRDGQGWLGRTLGQILAGSYLPMREWGKPEKPERWLYVEAAVIAAVLVIASGLMVYNAFAR